MAIDYRKLPVMEGFASADMNVVLCPDGHVCTEENGGYRCEADGLVYNDKGQRVATEDDVMNGDYTPKPTDPPELLAALD